MKQFIKNYWALSIPLVILIIALLFLFNKSSSHQNRVIGMVDADFTDVAASVPGRLDSLLVHQGDTVKNGQLLAVLTATEINIVKEQALAAITTAKSQLDLLKSGPGKERIQSAGHLYQIAEDQYELANTTYQRMLNLYQDSIISGQEKDMMYFKLQAAKKEMEMARLHQQSLENGSRPEMIQAAAAILNQAEKAYELSDAVAKHTRIYAPVAGIISTLVIHQGEVVAIGYPMMTIQKNNSYFIQFNIRQDQMKGLQKGDKVSLKIPGCQPETVDAEVSDIAPALSFANWVPQEGSGQFELRTFTIKCKPTVEVQGLRPGMTAALTLPE